MKNIKAQERNKEILSEEEQKVNLEKQIAAVQWIQTMAVLTEAILLTKLYSIDHSKGEEKILTGIWIQTLGQFTEAVGLTQQVSTSNRDLKFTAEKTATSGSFIQSLGAALQGVGGVEVLSEEVEEPFIL